MYDIYHDIDKLASVIVIYYVNVGANMAYYLSNLKRMKGKKEGRKAIIMKMMAEKKDRRQELFIRLS